jgi:hypothetical protein
MSVRIGTPTRSVVNIVTGHIEQWKLERNQMRSGQIYRQVQDGNGRVYLTATTRAVG